MKTFLITATPPTPNGDLHVGHLSGPYLGADVFTRYQRMRGNRAVYLCSGDDHQSYVMTTAKRQGRDPAELVEDMTATIKSTLCAMSIEMDLFTSALGNSAHVSFVQDVFRELYDRGVLQVKTRPALRCDTCDRYLFESFAKGACPHCGEEAAGNLCEACGRVNDPTELRDPVCSVCRSTPARTTYTGIFFPLEEYRGALAEFYASRTSWKPHLRALCDWLVSRPLPDYPVSYPSSWGIPVPVDGFEGQVINVWFEMYPGHIETTRSWAQLADEPGLAERLWGGDATLVQFLGYDNSFFNAVLHVATGIALGRRYALPEHIVTNEFYFLDGEKFSTSRNHAIWGRDIAQVVQTDALRYFLGRTNPEHMQTNFSYRDYASRVGTELRGVWEPTINGALAHIHEEFRGILPAESDPDLHARGLLDWAARWLERYYDLDEFSLRQASAVLHAYAEGCEAYFRRSVLARRGTPMHASRVASLGFLLKGWAVLAAPILPEFAQRLWSGLGLPGQVADAGWAQLGESLATPTRVGPAQSWFAQVDVGVRAIRPAALDLAELQIFDPGPETVAP